ncbi:hypothetical protein [Rhizobium tumorigenes]|uniref:hypothetical protein n=1 Tax=Rhizobium tumorigenes TaxID=2041385 RepID=UPI00241C47B6|nr:hypothetical protein [Rhizobium tumorigenes]WFS01612.1 hypothetical protein PR016_02960 [Rhizobium tumorigenes]
MRDQQTAINDKHDQDAMLKLYQERGAMTEKDLLAAGVSKESQIRNAPKVAELIRFYGTPIAA